MNPAAKRLLTSMLLTLCLGAGSALAGQNCSIKPRNPEDVRRGLELALKTREALNKSNAEVAVVARVGRDLSAYHLRYSHVGFAWRDHPRGEWTIVHELNDCGTASSALFDQGLGNFFLDDLYVYETKIVIPSADLQHKIGAGLKNHAGMPMYEPHYNLVSYAWGTRYQNSNQWVLETLAATLTDQPIASRAQAQAWLQHQAYHPATVHIDAPTRLGARLFRANVAFDDHPLERRIVGEIDLVSAESVMDFIQSIDPGASTQVLTVSRDLPPLQ